MNLVNSAKWILDSTHTEFMKQLLHPLNKIVRGNRVLLTAHLRNRGAASGTELVTLTQLGAALDTIRQIIIPLRNLHIKCQLAPNLLSITVLIIV
jgi:hypothetical protein